jgi:hypothetical protein
MTARMITPMALLVYWAVHIGGATSANLIGSSRTRTTALAASEAAPGPTSAIRHGAAIVVLTTPSVSDRDVSRCGIADRLDAAGAPPT